jgi:hypothetical protein
MSQESGIGDQGSVAPRKKRTWLWIVLGVVFVMFCVAVGAIFFTVSFFRNNMEITYDMTDSRAVNAFDAVRAKFPGQEPLLQLVDGRPRLVPQSSRPGAGQPLTTLHVLAFDRDDGELAKFSLPFWLLRMKSGPIELSAYAQGWDDRGVSFQVKDIEAAGPGIVADVDREREGRMLIWVE